VIAPATLRGYAATTYAATWPDGTTIGLRLGEACAQADGCLRQAGAESLTCLNAWNPRSRLLPVTRNMAAHQRLHRDLAARGYTVLPHLGVPDRHGWRAEPGFAVLDLETETAIGLAQTYGQFGIVRYERGGVAALILTRLAWRT
jgi:hypothetical protein